MLQDFQQFWPEEESKTFDDMIKVETLPADANNVENLKTKFNTEDLKERRFKLIDQRVSTVAGLYEKLVLPLVGVVVISRASHLYDPGSSPHVG